MSGFLQHFKIHINHGNHNLALQQLAEQWGSIYRHERARSLEWLREYLRCGGYVTSESWQCIREVVPRESLGHHGLLCVLDSGPPPPPSALPVGRAPCLCVTTEGYVREIQVFETGSPDKGRQRLLDPVGRALFRAVEKVFGIQLLWDPLRYDFSILDACGKEDAFVQGDSMGLSVALALCSYVCRQPLPVSLAASAVVTPEGRLGFVEGLDQKLNALNREKDYVSQVIVASDQSGASHPKLNLIAANSLEEVLSQVWPGAQSNPLFSKAPLNIEEERQKLDRLYDQYLTDTCIENASRLIAYLQSADVGETTKIRTLFVCHWRRGSCLTHKGQAYLASEDLKEALRICDEHPGVISGLDRLKVKNSYGVLLKDLFRYEQAEREHREVEEKIIRLGGTHHERGMNLSSLSQLLAAQGRFEEAEAHQKEAIELVEDEDKPRNRNYLAQIYVAWGRYDEAQKAVDQVWASLEERPERKAKHTRFIHWTEAELHCFWAQSEGDAFAGKPHWEKVHEIAELYPEPIEWWLPALIHRFVGLVLLQEGRETEGMEKLDRVIRFFDEESDVTMKTLGAQVHAERALYLLDRGNLEGAVGDMGAIVSLLSEQAHIREFFREEIRIGADLLPLVHSAPFPEHQMRAVLESVRKKIPY